MQQGCTKDRFTHSTTDKAQENKKASKDQHLLSKIFRLTTQKKRKHMKEHLSSDLVATVRKV